MIIKDGVIFFKNKCPCGKDNISLMETAHRLDGEIEREHCRANYKTVH